MRPPKATRVPVSRARCVERLAEARELAVVDVHEPEADRVGLGAARRRTARTSSSRGRAVSGTTTHAADAAPAASAASQRRDADVGEGLVDERLEALARLDGEAASRRWRRRRGCSRSGYLLREREQAVGAAHGQAVGEQRLDDVPIVAAVRARPLGELAHERRAALAARALEAALAAERGERAGRATGTTPPAGSGRSAARARGRPGRRGRRAPGSSPRRARAAAPRRSCRASARARGARSCRAPSPARRTRSTRSRAPCTGRSRAAARDPRCRAGTRRARRPRRAAFWRLSARRL